MRGPLGEYFAADHDRLDDLLRRALREPDAVDPEPFARFRAGLLRHIGMEEKRLFVAVRAGSAAAAALAAKLRVDHGAIAALLVPPPTPQIAADLRSVLGPHNRREEEPGGIYDLCDAALGPGQAARLVDELRSFPEPPLNPHNGAPAALEHARQALALSRRQWADEPKTAE